MPKRCLTAMAAGGAAVLAGFMLVVAGGFAGGADDSPAVYAGMLVVLGGLLGVCLGVLLCIVSLLRSFLTWTRFR
jgi:hypothetical protein